MTTERRSHHQTSSFASASNGSSNFQESNNNQKQQKGTQKSANGTGCLRLHCALLLLLLVLAAAAFDSVGRADAVSTWRMRTDKKAMRNSLVRFGKRAYRPAGEAFVSAVELADGMPMMFGGGRAFNSMPSRQMASWYRQQQLAAAMERPGGGGGGVEWTE